MALVAAIVGFGMPAQATNLVDYLNGEVALGRMDASEAFYWKITAFRDPSRLPEAFRRLSLPRCGTPIMAEAYQKGGGLRLPWKDRTSQLLLPPDDFEYHVDVTDLFPVRVSYRDPAHAKLAQAVAAAVQKAYRVEVDQMGWWRPPIEPSDGLYRMFIDDMGRYVGGYTAPYAPVPDTERADAYTYIVFNSSLDPRFVEGTVAHEFNHACQATMDAHEKPAFMENTAVFFETQVSNIDWIYAAYMIQAFQQYPYLPLEYMGRTMAYGYEYGGVLWPWFLDEVYGEGDPVYVREIWEHCIQPDGTPNEPDYMDAIDEMTADQGGIAEAVKTFVRYRFFMGRDDDGAHLTNSYKMWDSEVTRLDEWLASELPVHDVVVSNQVLPQPNGCNYIQLDEDEGDGEDIVFSFDGDPGIPWTVQLLQIPWHDLSRHLDMDIDERGHGELRVTPGVADRLVLVVCQIPGSDYDPDDAAWVKGPYVYSIAAIPPAPVVDSIEPASFEPGVQGVHAIVHGGGFVYEDGLSVSFSGEGTAVTLYRVLSDRALEVEVTVAGSAELGPRDVIVTNPGGEQGVGAGLVTIETSRSDQDAGLDARSASGDEPGPGRGCSASGNLPRSAGLLWFVAAVGLGVLRRRRQSH